MLLTVLCPVNKFCNGFHSSFLAITNVGSARITIGGATGLYGAPISTRLSALNICNTVLPKRRPDTAIVYLAWLLLILCCNGWSWIGVFPEYVCEIADRFCRFRLFDNVASPIFKQFPKQILKLFYSI